MSAEMTKCATSAPIRPGHRWEVTEARPWFTTLLLAALSGLCGTTGWGAEEPARPGSPDAMDRALGALLMPDEIYKDYAPVFERAQPEKLRGFSLQPTFYNRAYVSQDKRVDALVQEGIKREGMGDHREAIKHYQTIVQKFPESLVQVSEYGVFVSATLYVQQRILRFPKKELAYYRMLYDAQAREVYERARAKYSVEGLVEVANFHLATSYGSRALLDLGSRALDVGHCEEAARYFETVLQWFPAGDYDADDVNYRLAYAYRLLGRGDRSDALLEELKKTGTAQKRAPELKWELISALKPSRETRDAFEPQKRHPRYVSFSDYDLFPPLKTRLSTEEYQWRVKLPIAPEVSTDDRPSGGELIPFHLPWIVGNDLYYKHYNRIYCRSLATGKLRWEYDLGPLDREVRRLIVEEWSHPRNTACFAEQDILVDGGLVFSNVQVYGRRESLVAIDRVTGELEWAAGPIRPIEEEDMMTRYDGTPGLGRHAIYAPWSRDQGEGDDHLYTSVGLTAFEKGTGRILWRRELCQLSPTATTQRKLGVRVFSATPLVSEGVIYHVTNGGVVAAMDEDSGMVRWIVRYPHVWRKAGDMDAHDELFFGSATYSGYDIGGEPARFQNVTPLLKGDRLYVAPFDSDHFLCMDKRTGKILWNIVPPGPFEGVTRGGELVFTGQRLSFYDPRTHALAWSFTPSFRSTWDSLYISVGTYWHYMSILGHPTMTEDDLIYFSSHAVPRTTSNSGGDHTSNATYGEWCLSVKDRRLLDYRMYYSPLYRDQVEGVMKGRISDNLDYERYLTQVPPQDVNAPFPYDLVKRMPFRHHGVTFELVTSGDSLWADFDREALEKAVATGTAPEELFTRAELLLEEGKEEEAINAFERCKAGLKPEEREFIRQIDRELFGLYRSRAWKAHLAGDKELFHRRAVEMSQTAITVRQEVQSLLALADSFEWREEIAHAAKCLESIVRHYPGAVYAVPYVAIRDRAPQEKSVEEAVAGMGLVKPKDREGEFAAVERIVKKSVSSYFSTVAPIAPDVDLEAERLAVGKLVDLVRNHPKYRDEFEQRAKVSLSKGDPGVRSSEMRAFPGTKASQRVLDGLLAEAAKTDAAERQERLWKLNDLAEMLALKLPASVEAEARLVPAGPARCSFQGPFADKTREYRDAGETLRLVLTRSEDSGVDPGLLFVGGRSKKRLDNKFSLECWEMSRWAPKWEVTNLRLKGRGDEAGFLEVFVMGDQVITHGKNDVLAFGLGKGELRWRFELPFDFDFRAMNQVGQMLILSGATHTLGVQASSGKVVWSERELGELYHPPFVREGMLISVRREPYGVSFRRTGSGKLVRNLRMPDLSLETKHPVLAEDISRGALSAGVATEALPIACGDDLLMVTDGVSYIAVDVRKMEVRWKRPIDNNDFGSPPMRFFIQEPYLLVLKRDFLIPSLYLLDSRTGGVKWSKSGKEVVHSVVFEEDGKTFYGLSPSQGERNNVTVKCMETETGNEARKWEEAGYKEVPDVTIVGKGDGGRLVVRLIHRQECVLLVLDTRKGQVEHRVGMKGVGTYGVHGGKLAMVQGPYLVLMNPEQFLAAMGPPNAANPVGGPPRGGAPKP